MEPDRQAEVEEHRPDAEEAVEEDEGQQHGLDPTRERVVQVEGDDAEQEHGRSPLEEPRPEPCASPAPGVSAQEAPAEHGGRG